MLSWHLFTILFGNDRLQLLWHSRAKAQETKKKLEKPKPLSPSTHFNTTVSSKEIEKSSKGCVPVGTTKSTNWTICTFQQWLMQRNKRVPQEAFPQDILQKEYPTETLCNCLQRFVSEARRVDGTQYPLALFTKFFVDYFDIQIIAN